MRSDGWAPRRQSVHATYVPARHKVSCVNTSADTRKSAWGGTRTPHRNVEQTAGNLCIPHRFWAECGGAGV